MSAVQDIISALIATGMTAVDAASLVARAAVEMTVAPSKSAGAARQQRYRERNKASQSVTERNAEETSQTVTNRNESVTSLRAGKTPLTYLLPSLEKNLSEKKESKKERVPKKRDAPLPLDWQPSVRSFEIAEQHGVNVQLVEHIFRDYLKSSGKFYADYDAAFHNFLRNQRKFNGGSNHAKTDNPKSGSLIAAIDRQLAALEREEGTDFALPESPLLRISR